MPRVLSTPPGGGFDVKPNTETKSMADDVALSCAAAAPIPKRTSARSEPLNVFRILSHLVFFFLLIIILRNVISPSTSAAGARLAPLPDVKVFRSTMARK